jgi:peptidylamidoglycolate lyase
MRWMIFSLAKKRTFITSAFVLLLLAGGFLSYLLLPYPDAVSQEGYQVVEDWPNLPQDLALGQVAGVGVDSQNQIYLFSRREKSWQSDTYDDTLIASATILVLDHATGELLTSWGENQFVMPHGLTVDALDNVWVTDVGLHQVFKFDGTGKLLLTLGTRAQPGSDARHFNEPTDVSVATDGSFFVSDGYSNSRIVKFAADGTYLLEWGSKGTKPGQFDTPHSIAVDLAGHVYVADRGMLECKFLTKAGNYFRCGKDGSMVALGQFAWAQMVLSTW